MMLFNSFRKSKSLKKKKKFDIVKFIDKFFTSVGMILIIAIFILLLPILLFDQALTGEQ